MSAVETLLFRARRSLNREFKAIARSEGVLGVLLVPWYRLRRMLARGSSRRGRLMSGDGSSTPEDPAGATTRGGASSLGTSGAGGPGLQALPSTWLPGLSGLASAIPPPLIGSSLAAAAATAAIAMGSFAGGHAAIAAARRLPPVASVRSFRPSASPSTHTRVPPLTHGRVSLLRRTGGPRSGGGLVPQSPAGARVPPAVPSLAQAGPDHVPLPLKPAGTAHSLRSLVNGAGSSSGSTGRLSEAAAGTLSGVAGEVAGTAGHLNGAVGKLSGTARDATGMVRHLSGSLGKLSGAAAEATGTVRHLSGPVRHLAGGLCTLSCTGGTVPRAVGQRTGTVEKLSKAAGELTGAVTRPSGSVAELPAPGSPSPAAPVGANAHESAPDPPAAATVPAGQLARGLL